MPHLYLLVRGNNFLIYHNLQDLRNKISKGNFYIEFPTPKEFLFFVENTPFSEWKQHKTETYLEMATSLAAEKKKEEPTSVPLTNPSHFQTNSFSSKSLAQLTLDPPRSNSEGTNPVSKMLTSTNGPAYLARRVRTRRRATFRKRTPSPPPPPPPPSNPVPYTGKKRGRKPKALKLQEEAARKKLKKKSTFKNEELADYDLEDATDEEIPFNTDPTYSPMAGAGVGIGIDGAPRMLGRKKRVSQPTPRHFVCVHCNKIFDKKYNHDSHARVHLTTKPHKCFLCGKGFARNSDKKRHEKGHLKKMEKLGIHDRTLMEQMIKKEREKEEERQRSKIDHEMNIQQDPMNVALKSFVPPVGEAAKTIANQLTTNVGDGVDTVANVAAAAVAATNAATGATTAPPASNSDQTNFYRALYQDPQQPPPQYQHLSQSMQSPAAAQYEILQQQRAAAAAAQQSNQTFQQQGQFQNGSQEYMRHSKGTADLEVANSHYSYAQQQQQQQQHEQPQSQVHPQAQDKIHAQQQAQQQAQAQPHQSQLPNESQQDRQSSEQSQQRTMINQSSFQTTQANFSNQQLPQSNLINQLGMQQNFSSNGIQNTNITSQDANASNLPINLQMQQQLQSLYSGFGDDEFKRINMVRRFD